MISRILVAIANILMASVLVLLVSVQQVGAQEAQASGQLTIKLSGTGMRSNSGSLSISPNTVDFGIAEIGEVVRKSFVISNTAPIGGPIIEIQNTELFGQGALDISTPFNGFVTLAGQDAITVEVTFAPLTIGNKSGGMRLSIAGSTSPYAVLFSGEARHPLSSDLTASIPALDFGEVLKDSNATRTLVLTNSGKVGSPPIAVSQIAKTGTNADGFAVDFNPITLQPGEELSVQVRMGTDQEILKAMQMEIFHDGITGSLKIPVTGSVITANSVPVNFTAYTLNAPNIDQPTTLQFGPDGKLYVGSLSGDIHVLNVSKNGGYSAVREEIIGLITNVPNHNDDGTPNNTLNRRLLTGIHVVGTANNPIIYAASSDPRMGGGPPKDEWDATNPTDAEKIANGNDTDLDTNSGILHRLTKVGGSWQKEDLVRGLPRSEENHVPNGLVLIDNKIYLNVGGHTNQGAMSYNFAKLPEYALSAATLVIDLDALPSIPYDIPTLKGTSLPFGGQDGLNMAKLVQGGPVQIFASGLRNAYDIVHSSQGKLYTWDNGPNAPWGGLPGAGCSDDYVEGNTGDKLPDSLHLLTQGYYAGHPNPTRGSKSNTFGGLSPIEGPANPVECTFRIPGEGDGALATDPESMNGTAEYTATNFNNAMQGDLITAGFSGNLHRIQLNSEGTAVISRSKIWRTPLTDMGGKMVRPPALDVTTLGDDSDFPGTIWTTVLPLDNITVLEPDE